MKVRQLIYLILLILGGYACMPEEEVLERSSVELAFSTDTVFFDTLFTAERSVTKRLRIFNPGDKAVILESVALAGGEASPYTLFINGRPGKSFGEQRLLGKDSLLLLLEVRLPETAASEPYLALDAVVVLNQGWRQEVPIIGYGQNVVKLGKQILDCNTVWNSTRPYLIEDTIIVNKGCTLTIEKGVKVYFKPVATLLVGGSLIARGDSSAADQILFRNHRLDLPYENQPGQWKGIFFAQSSHGNVLRYCNIRNAVVGIHLGTPDEDSEPDLILENCRLENHLEAGLRCFTSDLVATNTLIANCVGPAVANLAGGNYRYTHCTFANYYTGQREAPAAYFADYFELPDGLLAADLNLVLQNSIIWGNLSSGNELIIRSAGSGQVTLQLEHNLIRSSNNEFAGEGNILNNNLGFVKFKGVGTYDFRPDSLSPAVNAAKPLGIEYDLRGKKRDSQPDIGALEFIKK